jgi:hypothetical protein
MKPALPIAVIDPAISAMVSVDARIKFERDGEGRDEA